MLFSSLRSQIRTRLAARSARALFALPRSVAGIFAAAILLLTAAAGWFFAPSNNAAASSATAAMVTTGTTRFNFDDEGKTDYAVYRPANNTWYMIMNGSGAYSYQNLGVGGHPAAADFDADGKTDYALWTPANGVWTILGSSASSGMTARQWGMSGDRPVAGDYDGDGRADLAVYRPSNNYWYILNSRDNTTSGIPFGMTDDVPVPGDYDGDGRTDVAVWRPSNGTWYVLYSSTARMFAQQWGQSGDQPVPADYDGDRKTDFCVWRGSYLRENADQWIGINSATRSTFYTAFGTGGKPNFDIAVPADYDGDGRDDIAVWRKSNGYWYWIGSASNTFQSLPHGQAGDIPIPAAVRVAPDAGTGGAGNQPPVARPGGPYTGAPGASVQFNGTASADPDGSIAAYSWNFGDGTTKTGATPTHVYAVAGTYNATLTVTDDGGLTHSAATTATIGTSPTPTPTPSPTPTPPTGAPRLAKEYIYGGSRMIAVEEAPKP